MKKIIFTIESVKGKVTDSISENLTDLDLESITWVNPLVARKPCLQIGFNKQL